MADELSLNRKQDLIVQAGENGIGDLLKPLIREVHLFDSYVAGTTHLQDPSVLDAVAVGDKLTLRREDNKFDEHAIRLLEFCKAHPGTFTAGVSDQVCPGSRPERIARMEVLCEKYGYYGK